MEIYVFILIAIIFIGVGIWIGSTKSKKDLTQGLVLFPNIFKTIGLVLAISSLVFVAYASTKDKEMWQAIAIHSANLGLLFYCFAKDKMEDELTSSVRLRSFYTSVIASICVLVVISLAEYLLGDKEFVYPARQFIFILLVVYAFSFTSLKRKVFYGE